MNSKIWTSISVILTLILVLSACSVSEERVLEHATESFEEKMVQEKKPITYSDENIELYVPSFTEVEVVDDYNIIFERDNHVFLMFLNDIVNFETKEELLNGILVEEPFIVETGEHEGEIGYLVVTEFENEEYKVVVGYDGIKVTTISTLSEMNDVAEMMFDMVQSVGK